MARRTQVFLLAGWIAMAVSNTTQAGQVGTPLKWQDHELPHVKRSHGEQIATRRHEYHIKMAGTVDMDHALTRECGRWRVGWQPNESLTIANIGSVPVKNAKVIINDRGDGYTMDGLLGEAIGSARNDQEKVYLIWQFARSNRHHDDPLYEGAWGSELHDPVKMLAIYGAGLCDDAGSIGASLFYAAGFRKPRPFVRCLHGHMMCEVFASGRWQFMDIDEDVFYLDRENELPVSGDVVARDHDLAHREFHYGPIFGKWQTGYTSAALFGRDDGRTTRLTQGYKIRVNLRPGERIEYRWDNIGKWAMRLPTRGRRWAGNSRKIYEPSPNIPNLGAEQAKHVFVARTGDAWAIAGANAKGELMYRMTSAFVFCGGRVSGSFRLRDAADRAVIEAWAKDNKGKGKTEPVTVWQAAGPGTKQADVEIDKAIDPTHGRPEYEFHVRVRLVSAGGRGSAALTGLSIRGDIMVSPIFLPRLRLGDNKVVYTDESDPGRKVRVVYRWRETTATKPLAAPKTVYPPDEQTLRDEIVTYRWQAVAGAVAYHLQVSRDPAMRWPYRPSLDVVYKGTEYAVPFWGIYAPDTSYHWRVRTQNDKGIWGDWGEIRTFRWAGPRVPVDVKLTRGDGVFTLSWRANPRGERPVRYEVYGSAIKGFSVSKVPHEIPTLKGKVPANLLGETRSTRMIVAGHLAASQTPAGVTDPNNLNRCYYRVVAIDRHGTRSGCSDYAEMPHPFIWTKPVTTVHVGRTFRYQPRVIRDLGDLQHRYVNPVNKFWEQEQLSFSLATGPKWLKADPKTGLLTGTPAAGSAGRHPVTLRVTAAFEKRTAKDKFTKDLPPRQSDQAFELVVSD